MARQACSGVREKILSAAFHVFSEKGYRQASVREISRMAGIATGGLYPYFGSKEQLYIEVLKGEMEQFRERMTPFRDTPPQTALRRYLETHLDFISSTREIVNRQFKDYDLAFVKPVAREFFLGQRKFIESIISRGVEQGAFRSVDCTESALFVLCLLKGALYYSVAGRMDLTQSRESICRAVLDFLKPEERRKPGIEGIEGNEPNDID